jgi:hypothetical protein
MPPDMNHAREGDAAYGGVETGLAAVTPAGSAPKGMMAALLLEGPLEAVEHAPQRPQFLEERRALLG